MSDNISVFEEYLFAENKAEFLESCKNASEVKKYIRMCHLLSHPETPMEEVDRVLLDQWKRSYNHGDKKSLVLKNELNTILAEGDATKRQALMAEFNQKYLGFSFNDYRQASGSQAQTATGGGDAQVLKTALTQADLDEMLTSTKIAELMNSETGNLSFSLNDLGVSNLSNLDFAQVKSWRVKETLFGFLPRFSTAEVDLSNQEHSANPSGLQGVPKNQRQEPVQLADPRTPPEQADPGAAGQSW